MDIKIKLRDIRKLGDKFDNLANAINNVNYSKILNNMDFKKQMDSDMVDAIALYNITRYRY